MLTALQRKKTKVYVGYAALHGGDDRNGEVVLVAETIDELESAWERYGAVTKLDREKVRRCVVLDGALMEGP